MAAVIPFGAAQADLAERWNGVCEKALTTIPGLKVVGAKAWQKEAKDSGQGDDLEAMAKRLEADVLVTGTLAEEQGGLWRISLDLFDDKGMPFGSLSIQMKGPLPGPAALFQLEDGLARLIRPAVGLKPQAEAPATGPGEEPAPQDADRERPAQLAPVEGLRSPKAGPKGFVRPPWRPVVEASLGLLVLGRTFSCGDPSAARRNHPCMGPDYPLDAGAGLRLSASVFPLNALAASKRISPALAGLGLSVLLDVPFWRDRVQADGASFPVRELRFEGGLRWRHHIGEASSRPVLEAGLQYGYHQFLLSGGSAQSPIPDIQYQYLLPSVGLGGFLLDSRLHLHGELGILGILTAGPLFAAPDNVNLNPFGPGSAWGFRLSALAEYRVYRGLWLHAGGSLERLGLSFDGSGCTQISPGPLHCDTGVSVSQGVRSASDLYLALWFGAGYRF